MTPTRVFAAATLAAVALTGPAFAADDMKMDGMKEEATEKTMEKAGAAMKDDMKHGDMKEDGMASGAAMQEDATKKHEMMKDGMKKDMRK